MHLLEFGDCCTARIIEDWGSDVNNYDVYAEAAKEQLIDLCDEMNTDEVACAGPEDEFRDLRNLGLIFATVNTQQKQAIKFAKSVGFRVTKGATKGRHRDTKLVGMFIDASDLYSWYVENE